MFSVVETFNSIQGEGFFSGHLSFFIRLAGCDIGCHWCDEKKSWKKNKHPVMSISDMTNIAFRSSAKIIVVTGGEPLMYNLNDLSKELKKKKQVHLETSGAYKLSGDWDWITLSPKKNKLPDQNIYSQANELKIIVYNKSDLTFALEESKKVSDNCLLYLQPEWSKKDIMTKKILEFIQKKPKFKLSIQQHKYLGLK